MPVATRLAICIPTHDGRAQTLRELLESIASQSSALKQSEVEICVSDNASLDGTGELIREFQARLPISLKYFRFARDMRGVRNFVNVVDMAAAEYCWLVGSDDMIPPGGIANVLSTLERLGGVAGMTFNKLNFDRTLSSYLGPDHDLVLPADPSRTRTLNGLPEIAQNLAMSFSFMSAHVFRRKSWTDVVSEVGIDKLCSMRHFPHSYVFLRMAATEGQWYWLADYCVIQRMDNFCILDENQRHLANYAEEITHDLAKVWDTALGTSVDRKRLLSRLFFLYWNPIAIFIYQADGRITASEQRMIRRDAVDRFRALPLFWLTSYPLLWVPGIACRGVMGIVKAVDRVLPLRQAWEWTHTMLAGILSRLRSGDRNAAGAKAAAHSYLNPQSSERAADTPRCSSAASNTTSLKN